MGDAIYVKDATCALMLLVEKKEGQIVAALSLVI